MRKNNDESDVFYYKGKYLFEQPPETKVYTRRYEEGVGLVAVLKKKTVFTELLCILVVVVNSLLLLFYPAISTKVYIPDEFNYYDGILYVNIVSDEENEIDVCVKILNEEYVLNPGERIYDIRVDIPPTDVDVSIESSFLIFNKTKDCIIPVKTIY